MKLYKKANKWNGKKASLYGFEKTNTATLC